MQDHTREFKGISIISQSSTSLSKLAEGSFPWVFISHIHSLFTCLHSAAVIRSAPIVHRGGKERTIWSQPGGDSGDQRVIPWLATLSLWCMKPKNPHWHSLIFVNYYERKHGIFQYSITLIFILFSCVMILRILQYINQDFNKRKRAQYTLFYLHPLYFLVFINFTCMHMCFISFLCTDNVSWLIWI